MKATVFAEHGGPEVLHYTDVPKPSAGPTDVLVRVRACALNHLDLWIRRGLPGISVPLPHILGSDIAGEIATAGEGVEGIKTGEKVVLSPGIPCGHCEQCTAGKDSQCRQYTLFGYMVPGGYAEYVRAPATNVVSMPPHLSYEEAAALPLVFVTAWHMLITRANLRPAEEVLVLGAGSGVGSAAIQIAKVAGARVIATAGSDEKLAKAKELGADDTILHSKQDIASEVKRLTDRRGVDVVFEHVGEATWEKSIRSLAVGGRLVTCGATTGFEGKIDIRYLFSRQISILGSYMGSKAELLSVMELVRRRAVKPVLDKIFPLAQAAEAHRRLESRGQFGKVVLRIP
ncbi:MAG TPA: zinc-binding dehydrogenase [Candidatus Acidoferrum sp.]|nr:zinc-binding dehydrogenase [Candidatus Acidoferrum sp.]